MNRKRKSIYGLLALLLITLACRPVFAISWNEFLLLSGLIAVLLGPALYRLLRKVEEFLKNDKKK